MYVILGCGLTHKNACNVGLPMLRYNHPKGDGKHIARSGKPLILKPLGKGIHRQLTRIN